MHARMWADYTVVTIDKYDLESKNSLWSVNVDALGECAVNSKFVAKVLGKDKNIWTMEVSVISFEGQEKISNFKLNTETFSVKSYCMKWRRFYSSIYFIFPISLSCPPSAPGYGL